MLTVSLMIVPLCILVLAGYKVSYNDRDFQPASTESSAGYAVADKHFPKSWLSTDMLYVQSDHDMRNTADMIALDRVAKNVFRVPGVSLVQSVTRPNGRPLEHASLPYAMGSAGTKIGENIGFLRDRVADIDKMAGAMGRIVDATTQMETLTNRMGIGTHLTHEASDRLKAATEDARDKLADFDDFFRPIRSYFYWEKHCFDIPVCWAFRSLNESLDNVDKMAEELGDMSKGVAVIDAVTPQMVTQMHAVAENTVTMQNLTLTLQSLLHATIPQLDSMIHPLIDMGQAFDNAKNDDFFFLPPDSFNTPDFKVGLNFFMTPDGRGARIIVYHKGEAMSAAGIKQIEDASAAAEESLKGTSLSRARLSVAGAASNYRDVRDFARNDVTIMMLATFALVFLIILVTTRALAAACVVLATVVLSFAAAFGLSVFVWQNLIGLQLHWLTLPIAFIVLVAVGCDYNLLLLSRYKEELNAGIGTGLIRTMGSSGSVVITAGLVFAFTMLALTSSDVKNIGQAGSTICIGLMLDLFVIRLFMVMPLARLLGRWFWWPLTVRSRPRA
jgi:RND superfamily putative drug exporter